MGVTTAGTDACGSSCGITETFSRALDIGTLHFGFDCGLSALVKRVQPFREEMQALVCLKRRCASAAFGGIEVHQRCFALAGMGKGGDTHQKFPGPCSASSIEVTIFISSFGMNPS